MYGLSIVCLRYKMIQNDHIIRFDLTGLLCSTLTTASLSFQQRPSNMGYPKCVTQKPSKLLSKAIKSQMSQLFAKTLIKAPDSPLLASRNIMNSSNTGPRHLGLVVLE